MPWGNWLGSHGAGATRLISHGVSTRITWRQGCSSQAIRFLIIKLQLIRFNFRESLLSTGFFLFFRNRSSTSIRSSSSSSLESVVVDRGFKNSRFFVLLSCSESGSDQFLKTYLFRIVEVLPLPRNFFVLNSWSPVSFRETGISSARVLWVSRNEFRIVPVCYSIVRVHNRTPLNAALSLWPCLIVCQTFPLLRKIPQLLPGTQRSPTSHSWSYFLFSS